VIIIITTDKCKCLFSCGRTRSTGFYCKGDRKIHLCFYTIDEIADIIISHEYIHLLIDRLIGWRTSRNFDNLFRRRKVSPKDLSRKGCLEIMEESGMPVYLQRGN